MAAGKSRELAKRLGSALVLIPLVLYAMFRAPLVFEGIVVVFAVIGVREFYQLTEMRGTRPLKTWGVLFTVGMCLAAHTGDETFVYYVLTAGVLLSGTVLMTRNRPNGMLNYAVTVLGLTYVGWFIAHVVLLIQLEPDPSTVSPFHGNGFVILLLAILMMGDSGAYFVGRAWGRHKLIPGISPNKTIEGAAGGLAFSALGALICKEFQILTADHFGLALFPTYSHLEYVYVALLAGGVGQVGDLVESFLKRDIGVKDSGTFLPGHGGFLDRFDSLLFAAPVLYYYARYVH